MTETVDIDGTECVVIPKAEYEQLHDRIDELQTELDTRRQTSE